MQTTKRMTAREYLKQHPEKYVMVTREFGEPLYISPLKDLNVQVTTERSEAELWSALDTTDAKLGYHKAVTGYKGLVFEVVG